MSLFDPAFPLYRNDGRASVYVSSFSKQALENFAAKLADGVYRLEDNPCMCGAHDDVVVSEKDRYGIPCTYVLCRNCGLVRQQRRLDDASTALFYRDDYRSIYTGREIASDKYFHGQCGHGEWYYSFMEQHADIESIKTVFEAGCGAGGNIYAFHKRGRTASGCDFGEKYINYGIAQGLSLYVGEPDLNRTPAGSQDLVILSHVLEHLNHPLEYVNNLAELVSPRGYLLVQVPGIFTAVKYHISPIRYFQNAHVSNFYNHYLHRFFTVLGLEVVYGDEECTFLMRKPENWTKPKTEGLTVWDEQMPEWSLKVAASLKKDYMRSLFSLKYIATRTLDVLGLKGIARRLTGRE